MDATVPPPATEPVVDIRGLSSVFLARAVESGPSRCVVEKQQ